MSENISKVVKGTPASDKLIVVAKNKKALSLLDYPNVETEAVMKPLDVYMETDFDNNNRPYLRITSEVNRLLVKKSEDFPFNVGEIDLGGNNAIPVELFYNFTDKQLADLVLKGYFTKDGLDIPQIIYDTDLRIDVATDFKVVDDGKLDKLKKDEQPLIFVEVRNNYHHEISFESTGYDLAEVFESKNKDIYKNKDNERAYDSLDFEDEKKPIYDKEVIDEEYKEEVEKAKEDEEKILDSDVVVNDNVDKTFNEMMRALEEDKPENKEVVKEEKSVEELTEDLVVNERNDDMLDRLKAKLDSDEDKEKEDNEKLKEVERKIQEENAKKEEELNEDLEKREKEANELSLDNVKASFNTLDDNTLDPALDLGEEPINEDLLDI